MRVNLYLYRDLQKHPPKSAHIDSIGQSEMTRPRPCSYHTYTVLCRNIHQRVRRRYRRTFQTAPCAKPYSRSYPLGINSHACS